MNIQSWPEHIGWLREFQLQERAKFLQRGIPTRKEERFKYTDFQYLKNLSLTLSAKENHHVQDNVFAEDVVTVILVNGYYTHCINSHYLPDNIILCSLQEAIDKHTILVKDALTAEMDEKKYPFAILNSALLQDGVFLYVPNNTNLISPIHIININKNHSNTITNARNIYVIGENSKAIILEEFKSDTQNDYVTNVTTQLFTKANAQLYYHKIQNENKAATHLAQLFITPERYSEINCNTLALGSAVAREEIFADLSQSYASVVLQGFYAPKQSQHLDNHLYVNHSAPHTQSQLLYKGILKDKSKAVFNGKVYVHPQAQKIQSQQANHNLLLSPSADVYTKPELEIYADDVKCAHGATVGQLDETTLFYLRSRGIDRDQALSILTQAFARDILKDINNNFIMQRLQILLNEALQ